MVTHFASESTIVDWKSMTRKICTLYFLKYPCIIGGPGHIVEIDESVWTKRKYNKGRQVSNQWILGSIHREIKDYFAVLVDNGDAATLLSIIEKFILPEATIYSGQYKTYYNISRLSHDYTHETVNHSLNFVSPETLAHVQNVENM